MGGDHHRMIGPQDEEALKRLRGYEAPEHEAALGSARWDAEVERALEIGVPPADSVQDRTISTFSRTELPHFAGINTFMRFRVRGLGTYGGRGARGQDDLHLQVVHSQDAAGRVGDLDLQGTRAVRVVSSYRAKRRSPYRSVSPVFPPRSSRERRRAPLCPVLSRP